MAEKHEAGDERTAPLSSLSDYEVADDSVDVRGWTVRGSGGAEVGRVEDLIVDVASMRARYLVVSLSGDAGRRAMGEAAPHLDAAAVGATSPASGAAAAPSGAEPVLVPVSRARIEEGSRRVHLDSSGTGLAQLPRYQGRVDRDYHDTFGRHEQPGAWTEDSQRMTLSAEELRVGKRTVPAGEVTVHKHVETERVSEPVTRMREEVHVERRPVSGREGSRAEIRDDQIRVPITEEEVTVEKRPVVKEELVISKDRVEETEQVQADVRKERLDVDRSTSSARSSRDEPRGRDPRTGDEV